jgi:hypothetical protein
MLKVIEVLPLFARFWYNKLKYCYDDGTKSIGKIVKYIKIKKLKKAWRIRKHGIFTI